MHTRSVQPAGEAEAHCQIGIKDSIIIADHHQGLCAMKTQHNLLVHPRGQLCTRSDWHSHPLPAIGD